MSLRGRRVQQEASDSALAPNAAGRARIPAPEPEGSRHDLVLGPEARGQRLDRALADRFPEHSRTAVTGWIREGRVQVDGEARPAKARVEGGEQVVVWIPPPRPTHLEPQDLPLDVLHEDDEILVLDKPTGLTVHPGAGQHDGTLANALAWHFRDLPALGGADRPGIVHRLDKETSGVMVVARTEAAHRTLSAAFAERRVAKTYLACAHGAPDDEHGAIEAPIGRSFQHRTKMAVSTDGRAAYTGWSVERRLPRHTLIRCEPRTGRTHQIRVHLAHLGLPIVGDPTYGRGRGGPGEELAPRLLLHAWRLAFEHPGSGASVSFEAPLPEDFRAALEALAALEPTRRRR